MSNIEKIKKTVTIALGFALATYLIMSGTAMLNQEQNSTKQGPVDAKNKTQP